MLDQIVRELHVFRQILIVASAASNGEAERLMDKALPIIMELRGTLISWRAREGIEVPEYDHSKEAEMLERLIHNHSGQRHTEKDPRRKNRTGPQPRNRKSEVRIMGQMTENTLIAPPKDVARRGTPCHVPYNALFSLRFRSGR
ncbi:hypothetical protein QCN27_17415 [Cereibacter sp. SYSU M97828]|nr:hypothetical protein [Cereibacter flavus]